MTGGVRTARSVTGALAVALVIAASVPARAELTEAARLATAYDQILAARFSEAEQALSQACPPAPTEACRVIRAVALWWQILLDPDSRRLDETFRATAEAALEASEAWTRREPKRAEAWFYFAGAHAPLVQWYILRGERLAAARAGSRVKDALEQALALDPTLQDAYFGIGLYHYYADVAPAGLRLLRWLLLLPGGDRERGLAEMLKARDGGVLMRGEADYQLHFVYLWYEEDHARALALLRGLESRHPSNPIFLQRIAEVQLEYVRDDTSAEATWRLLLERAEAGELAAVEIGAARARLGLAARLIARGEPAAALEHLDRVVGAAAESPLGAAAQAQVLRGDAFIALADRVRARAAYEAAIVRAPPGDPGRARSRAREALRRNF